MHLLLLLRMGNFMLFDKLYKKTHELYQKLGDVLMGYDFSKTPEQQRNLLDLLLKLNYELKELDELHRQATASLLQAGSAIWVREFSPSCPKCLAEEKLNYLTQQYRYFVNRVLDASKVSSVDQEYIKSLVLQLMTDPCGQNLIVELNSVVDLKAGVRIAVRFGKSLGVILRDDAQQTASVSSHPQLFKPNAAKTLLIDYPENYHIQNLLLQAAVDSKVTPITYQPQFVAFAHELIHCLHILKGNSQQFDEFPDGFAGPIYCAYSNLPSCIFPPSVKELLTVEGWSRKGAEVSGASGGTICENVIRAEHGIPKRGSHAQVELDPQYDFVKGMRHLAFISRLRAGETDFSNMFLAEIAFPRFVDQAALKINSRNAPHEPQNFSYVSYAIAAIKSMFFYPAPTISSTVTTKNLEQMQMFPLALKNC